MNDILFPNYVKDPFYARLFNKYPNLFKTNTRIEVADLKPLIEDLFGISRRNPLFEILVNRIVEILRLSSDCGEFRDEASSLGKEFSDFLFKILNELEEDSEDRKIFPKEVRIVSKIIYNDCFCDPIDSEKSEKIQERIFLEFEKVAKIKNPEKRTLFFGVLLEIFQLVFNRFCMRSYGDIAIEDPKILDFILAPYYHYFSTDLYLEISKNQLFPFFHRVAQQLSLYCENLLDIAPKHPYYIGYIQLLDVGLHWKAWKDDLDVFSSESLLTIYDLSLNSRALEELNESDLID